YDVKPLTFIIPDENLYTVKSYFIDNDCLINDGYESISFNQKSFEAPAIINKKNNNLTNTSFKVRILSQTTFENLLEFNINGFWVLINTSNHKLINESSYQVLNNLNTNRISSHFLYVSKFCYNNQFIFLFVKHRDYLFRSPWWLI